jgi:D-alanyl-D-alanine carboxypeptidase/D-alanyl-D-alanine-endopeptidase (penicillin-binding protein 4)
MSDREVVEECLAEELALDPRLGVPQVHVLDAQTGEVLFDRSGDVPARTASVLKVLTSAAALHVLGPDYRIPTIVVRGSLPGEVVLVGRGDLTITRLPSGTESFYPGAAHLDELAEMARLAWEGDPATAGTPITRLVLDSSFFGGPEWLPSWAEEERTVEGCATFVTALQADSDREDPTAAYCDRSATPIERAGRWFADALGGSIEISRGTAPDGAVELARVVSPPVSDVVEHGLRTSDNPAMEMLARLVAIESGYGNTFAAASEAVLAALGDFGVPTDGIRLADGSGLSAENAVPLSYITRLLVAALNREHGLGLLYDRLPVSGVDGVSTLSAERFTGDNAIVGGAVHAKTGFIDNTYTLAGIVHARDGSALAFAVFALGDVDESARVAIDTLVTAFYRCGRMLAGLR